MPPPGYKTITLDDAVLERAAAYARSLDYSDKQFVQNCVSEICDLVETAAGARRVPKLVLLLDVAKRSQDEDPVFANAPPVVVSSDVAVALEKLERKAILEVQQTVPPSPRRRTVAAPSGHTG